jgi:PAS domain S-box-containing protein
MHEPVRLTPRQRRAPWLEAPVSGAVLVQRVRTAWPVALLGGYTLAAAIWLGSMWNDGEGAARRAAWVPLPSQLGVLFLIAALLHERHPRPEAGDPRRMFWRLMFAAVAVNFVATIGWTYLAAINNTAYGTWGEALYLLSYPILACGYAFLLVDQGAPLRSARVWLDAATLALGLGIMLWPFLLAPLAGRFALESTETLVTVGYVLGTVLSTIPAVLIYTQVMNWRAQPALACVIAFAIGSFVTDAWWVAYDARNIVVPGAFYNALYCALYTLIAAAAVLDRRGWPTRQPTAAAGNSYSFLPAFAVLLAIGMLAAQSATAHGLTQSASVLVALAGAAMVAARQFYARFDLQRLHHELARRDADRRVTELVRHATDAIAVVAPDGSIAYVSPAAERIFGMTVDHLVGAPISRLLGPENSARLQARMDARGPTPELDIELQVGSGRQRRLQIEADDQSANPAIAGVVLTIRDVTDLRRVEQEILDVAARERQRMSRDAHEGLAQELTGIAMMLQSLARSPGRAPDAAPEALDAIRRYVDDTIAGVRRLAVDLSPLQIVSGSLELALRSLADDLSRSSGVVVAVDWRLAQDDLPRGVADHLYQIARVAITGAIGDPQCRDVRVALHSARPGIELAIASDGTRNWSTATLDQSMRIIAYRVKLLGGTLDVQQMPTGGIRIFAFAPLDRPGTDRPAP